MLNKTKHYLADSPEINASVQRALGAAGLRYGGNTLVRHPLDILVNDVGLDVIREKVVRPLKGLKVAPYYGCQVVRPYATFDDAWNPTTMDRLLTTLGAEVVPYLATRVRAGDIVFTMGAGDVTAVGPELVKELSGRLEPGASA